MILMVISAGPPAPDGVVLQELHNTQGFRCCQGPPPRPLQGFTGIVFFSFSMFCEQTEVWCIGVRGYGAVV